MNDSDLDSGKIQEATNSEKNNRQQRARNRGKCTSIPTTYVCVMREKVIRIYIVHLFSSRKDCCCCCILRKFRSLFRVIARVIDA